MCSVVYYMSGAVKHGNILILPDGTVYNTATQEVITKHEAGGNAPWTSDDVVTAEIDCTGRSTLQFRVGSVLQPVTIHSLPAALRFGV